MPIVRHIRDSEGTSRRTLIGINDEELVKIVKGSAMTVSVSHQDIGIETEFVVVYIKAEREREMAIDWFGARYGRAMGQSSNTTNGIHAVSTIDRETGNTAAMLLMDLQGLNALIKGIYRHEFGIGMRLDSGPVIISSVLVYGLTNVQLNNALNMTFPGEG